MTGHKRGAVRAIAVGAAVACVVVAITFAALSNGESSPETAPSESGTTTTPTTRSWNSGMPAWRRMPAKPIRAWLVPRERQPDETESNYVARTTVLDLYDDFLVRAELTPQQEAQLLNALADASANAEAYKESIRAEIRGGGTPMKVKNFSRQFEDSFELQIAEFLSPEQVAAWRTAVGSSYLFVRMGCIETVEP